MRILLIIIFVLFFSITAFSQTIESKDNSAIFELAGNGGLCSINFEKNICKKKISEFNWRIGLSFAPIDKNNGIGLVFPLMVNSLIGKNSHKLELGFGQGITITTKGNFFALALANIGYRYQPSTSKLFYRITYTPLISYIFDFQIQQWGGISIGYTFKCKTK